MPRILFITPYPFGAAPSQRFRFEQYFGALQEAGYSIRQEPFWSERAWKILYRKGNFFRKFLSLGKAILKRYLLLFSAGRYDFIFIHREFSPVGLPLAVWIMARLMGKKIIFDFDDAIWIPNVSESNRLFRFLKVYSNTRRIIRLSYNVSCGNEYLRNFALQYNPRAFYNPTTIDTEHHHNRIRQLPEVFTIGWTGSHSTIQYLEEVIPVIARLEQQYPIRFHVISDRVPPWKLNCLQFIPWQKDTEVDELLKFSAGLMPLRHDPWSEGKCGFKALQYMALGIPALVSPVGVNTTIVDHGINGYYCRSEEEWEQMLRQLIENRHLLETLSAATRDKIVSAYSVHSNRANFINLFT